MSVPGTISRLPELSFESPMGCRVDAEAGRNLEPCPAHDAEAEALAADREHIAGLNLFEGANLAHACLSWWRRGPGGPLD
jgi:hypothetical protein